jgi:hypothetical protein
MLESLLSLQFSLLNLLRLLDDYLEVLILGSFRILMHLFFNYNVISLNVSTLQQIFNNQGALLCAEDTISTFVSSFTSIFYLLKFIFFLVSQLVYFLNYFWRCCVPMLSIFDQGRLTSYDGSSPRSFIGSQESI